MRKAPVVAALRAQRAATLRRLAQLSEDDWGAVCLPPRTVRHLAAGQVALDEAWATGRIYRALRAASDDDDFTAWRDANAARWSATPTGELLEALVRWGERAVTVIARTPSMLGQVPMRTWLGRHPVIFYTYRRVIDEWVHDFDVARAAASDPAVAAHVDPAVPDVLAAGVLHTLPGTVLPRTQRTSGVLQLIVETEEGRRRTWGVDFARRQYGPRVTAAPDTVVRTDAATLTLLFERRLDRRSLPPTRMMVEGEEGLAHDLLDALARARS